MLLVDAGRRLRMIVAIMSRGESENEDHDDKNDYSFFLRSKNESLLERIQPGKRMEFQFRVSSFMRGRTRMERNLFLMWA